MCFSFFDVASFLFNDVNMFVLASCSTFILLFV